MTGLNRLERWLIQKAYPEIDFTTVNVIRVNKRRSIVIPYLRAHGVATEEIEPQSFRWCHYYHDDYAEFVHYAQIQIGYSREINTLIIVDGSLKRNRQMTGFMLAEETIP